MVIYPALLLWEVAKRNRLRESSQAHQEFYLFLDSNAYRGILIGSAAVYTGIAVEFIGFVGFVITVGYSPIANAYRVLSIAGLCVWFSGFLLDYFAAKSAARRAQALLADAPKRLAKPLGVNTSLSVSVSTAVRRARI